MTQIMQVINPYTTNVLPLSFPCRSVLLRNHSNSTYTIRGEAGVVRSVEANTTQTVVIDPSYTIVITPATPGAGDVTAVLADFDLGTNTNPNQGAPGTELQQLQALNNVMGQLQTLTGITNANTQIAAGVVPRGSAAFNLRDDGTGATTTTAVAVPYPIQGFIVVFTVSTSAAVSIASTINGVVQYERNRVFYAAGAVNGTVRVTSRRPLPPGAMITVAVALGGAIAGTVIA